MPEDRPVFVRPDSDSKAFGGDVVLFGRLAAKFRYANGSNPYLREDTEILLAALKDIEQEWRCFTVHRLAVLAFTTTNSLPSFAQCTGILERKGRLTP